MIDLFFELVSGYGAIVIALATFLSCLFLPVPSSVMMLAGGAFVASGDMSLIAVLGGAFTGAVLGDQLGYRIGRWGGPRLSAWLARRPGRAAVLARAQATLRHWGGVGVFFSTWAVAPLGPWVNVAAGGAGMSALRFTIWDMAGEAIWVTLYVGLGYSFAANLDMLASTLGNAVGALSAGVVALLLGWVLIRRVHRDQANA